MRKTLYSPLVTIFHYQLLQTLKTLSLAGARVTICAEERAQDGNNPIAPPHSSPHPIYTPSSPGPPVAVPEHIPGIYQNTFYLDIENNFYLDTVARNPYTVPCHVAV